MDVRARIEATGPLLAKGPKVVQQHLERFVASAVLLLEREVKVKTPRGVGAEAGLAATISHEVQGRGTLAVKGIVSSNQPHAEVIEKGRRPGKGWPPPKVLLPWIQLKFGLSPKEAERVEYAVRRKIGQKGFPGVHMFEKAFTENLGRLQSMAARAGLEIALELNG